MGQGRQNCREQGMQVIWVFALFKFTHIHTLHFGKLTEAMNNLPIHFYIYTLNMIENE